MQLKKVIYGWIEKNFLNGCSDYNSLSVRKSCRSKFQSREMFAKHGIPYAKGLVFFNPYTAYKFAKEHGFPLVLKPNVGGFSRGSHFPINNFKEFWIAMFFVKFWWPTSVVEQYLKGKNYRVVTTKDSVDIAMRRYPAFVTGDGKNSISELIDVENRVREEMKLTPVIHLIEKSAQIARHLKKHGLNFDSIPKSGEEIELYHRVSLAPGGVLKTIDVKTITPKNKELFIKILDLFESNLFGIDVIMEQGIDVDYDKQKCIFLEVNSRPYLKMHAYPRYGQIPDMEKFYKKLDVLEVVDRGVF
ncbi:cyanophycin synthetase [Candidatus Gracilibacteria bacterium]|nr:cyanophycin synthetase [Candidatus Gracilibacteria bacterium]